MQTSLKIGIFDDHTAVIEGVTQRLIETEQINVSFQCTTVKCLKQNSNKANIDILIMDVVTSETIGLELFKWLKNKNVKIIAYTSLYNSILIENLIDLGVKGYVNKKKTLDDLVFTILEVAKGKTVFPQEFNYLNTKFKAISNSVLTKREIEVLKLIAIELTSSEIAEKLNISISTVENHRKNIFEKFDVKNVVGMILTASRNGYLT